MSLSSNIFPFSAALQISPGQASHTLSRIPLSVWEASGWTERDWNCQNADESDRAWVLHCPCKLFYLSVISLRFGISLVFRRLVLPPLQLPDSLAKKGSSDEEYLPEMRQVLMENLRRVSTGAYQYMASKNYNEALLRTAACMFGPSFDICV